METVEQVVKRIEEARLGAPVTPLQGTHHGEFAHLIDAFNALLNVLAERKAMLREVLNTSTVGIFATDDSMHITLANEAFAGMLGLSSQGLLGHPYTEYLSDTNSPHADQMSEGVSEQGLEQTRRLRRADGQEFWAHISLRLFQTDSTGPKGLVGVLSDVTAQVNARDNERFRRGTLELLARNSPLPEVLEAIVRGVEVLRPKALCSILQLSADGKHLGQCVSPSLPAFYNEAIEGLAIGPYVGSCGAAAYQGARVVAQDILAHPHWVAYRDLASRADLRACWSEPVLDGTGSVLGTIAMYHRCPQEPQSDDIELIEQAAHLTSLAIGQHRAAQSLRASQERFRLVMETSPSVAVRGYTADGTLVYWNNAAERMFGYSVEEALGSNLFELLFVADDRENMRALVAESFASDTPLQAGEIGMRHKDGHTVTVFSSHSLIERDLHGKECFCLDVDLSESKRAQAALRESEERYRSMIEWNLQPMAVHRAGQLVYVNPATVKMMGASSAAEMVGRSILDWVHPDSRALVLQRARHVAQTGEGVPLTSEKWLC
jgi:PAS domain S-box-containing protein